MQIYNSYSRKKEELIPLEPQKIRMYVCGPTVYDDAHLGHARSQIAFDVIRRYLIFRGYKVNYVSNYTDVEDKMIKRSHELHITVKELADKIIASFKADMAALNVLEATVHPKATEEIPGMIAFIEELIEKGYAYEYEGDVFFDVPRYAEDTFEYGSMTNFDYTTGSAAADDEATIAQEKKRHKADFALWKHQKPGEPAWDSPWGKGRPGWHIECSVMSMRYLGEQIDIHGGGSDLKFPHHTNEIAQSEARSGKQFSRYWCHNGFVNIDKEKMSKSLGNFRTIKDLLKSYDGETIRLFCVMTHYRGPIDFSVEALDQAKVTLQRIRDVIMQLQVIAGSQSNTVSTASEQDLLNKGSPANQWFIKAMDDDFNTSGAFAPIFELVRDINGFIRSDNKLTADAAQQLLDLFKSWNTVLGVLDSVITASNSQTELLVHSLIDLLLDVRKDARKEKLYAVADDIRNKIQQLGVHVEDAKGTALWKYQKQPTSQESESNLKSLLVCLQTALTEFKTQHKSGLVDKVQSFLISKKLELN